MTNQKITLALEKREIIGKGLNKLRNEGFVPAVIHDHGKDSLIVSGKYNDVFKVYQEAGRHHPVNVQVGDKNLLTIIKEVDIEPTKHLLRHIVFGTIKQNEKVETEVPVELTGDAPAAKIGLVISKQLYHVQIEALPKDLPDEILVSIDQLEQKGDKITIADITPPSGVTILDEPEQVIVAVEEETIQQVEEPEAAEEAAETEETAGAAEEKTDESELQE